MNETLGYKQFVESLKTGLIRRLYALEGPEEYLVGAARAALRCAILPAGLESLNETILDNPPIDALISAAETLPAFAQRRLIYVRAMDIFTADRVRDAQARSDALVDYLPRVPDTACVVFRVPANADKRRSAVKALLTNAAVVACVTPPDADIVKFIHREVKARGAAIEPDVVSFLMNWSGRGLVRLTAELDKLCAYRSGQSITEADIAALAIRTDESTVFQWLDALIDGDSAVSLAALETLKESGESIFPLLALAERRMRQLLYIDRMARENRPAADIARTLGVPDFLVRRETRKTQTTRSQPRSVSLRAGLALLMDTNEAIRSGRLNEDDALPRVQFGLSAMALSRR
ncbi:MAG: DNA polymerase III subunit delta [Oscillospiraceae bacterium]|jgi:DNA polymerase-3 subunit delta|nr:DNA polymerase III subunit delta [Oscillospiraceae bacterium]